MLEKYDNHRWSFYYASWRNSHPYVIPLANGGGGDDIAVAVNRDLLEGAG